MAMVRSITTCPALTMLDLHVLFSYLLGGRLPLLKTEVHRSEITRGKAGL